MHCAHRFACISHRLAQAELCYGFVLLASLGSGWAVYSDRAGSCWLPKGETKILSIERWSRVTVSCQYTSDVLASSHGTIPLEVSDRNPTWHSPDQQGFGKQCMGLGWTWSGSAC